MNTLNKRSVLPRVIVISACLLLTTGLAVTSGRWLPTVNSVVDQMIGSRRAAAASIDEHAHGPASDVHSASGNDAHADHAHAAHDDASSLELSAQARRNLGLTDEYIDIVRLSNYRRFITIPAIIAARPGRTQVHVSTPLNGVITHVHAVTGESVIPGSLLFEIRLTHEDLVQSQTDFLKSLGELDVETREMARLKAAAQSGALSERTLLERQYAIDRLQSLLTAQMEALRLHGLSDRQVQGIRTSRKLLRELRIYAPMIDEHNHNEELHLADDGIVPVRLPITSRLPQNGDPQNRDMQNAVHGLNNGDKDHSRPSQANPAGETTGDVAPLLVETLNVHKGQSVTAGDLLCTVADYRRLYIQGKAFEQDVEALSRVISNNWPLTAVFDTGEDGQQISNLSVSFVGNLVEPESRTLPLYVDLTNTILQDQVNDEQQRFISWKYRPGQRLQLRIPVEEWVDQIVLPVEAVTREGADAYVFRQYGSHFDRVPVHVLYADQQAIVVANDGSLKPGAVIAMRAAHQMQMALKIKAGGGADPHAGHNH